MYGCLYLCDHPVYSRCTLFEIGKLGLAVVQQRFDPATKKTWWTDIDKELTDPIYLAPGFKAYFDYHAKPCTDGLYPTVSLRQIMWALKMKPLKKERWETVFDRPSL